MSMASYLRSILRRLRQSRTWQTTGLIVALSMGPVGAVLSSWQRSVVFVFLVIVGMYSAGIAVVATSDYRRAQPNA